MSIRNRDLSEIRENMTWQMSVDWVKFLKGNWIVPDKWQLFTMYRAYELGHPDLQDMKDRWFWSSSIYKEDTESAWFIYFNDGSSYIGSKLFSIATRCVRKNFIDELVTWIQLGYNIFTLVEKINVRNS